MFGSTPAITFLIMDVDTDEPHSIQVANDTPLQAEVKFDVPDSVPSDAAGLGDGAGA